MKYIVMLSSITIAAVATNVGAQCPPACGGGGSSSYLTVTLIEMGQLTPPKGFIELGFFEYATFEDGCEHPTQYWVERECSTLEVGPRMTGRWKSWGCAVICGTECPGDIDCGECNMFTHGSGQYSYYFEVAGRGDFVVTQDGIEVFRQSFNFGGDPDYFSMTFTDIEFVNKDFTHISSQDIFDAMESVGISVAAEYVGDQPPPAVGVILRSNLNQDTLVVDLPLEDEQWNTATYSGLLEAGLFPQIIGDPDKVLPPYTEAEIRAEPVTIECQGQSPTIPPVDVLPIANFQIFVQEISFESDYDLCKDAEGQPGLEEPINDPVWIRNTLNEPVAYMRNSSLVMNVELICNRTPYHDFEYSLMATGGENQGNYITEICEGHFRGAGVSTITNITPRGGAFPDHVGIIDPLTYNWWVKKVPGPSPEWFRFANTSTHKIFLTYDKPLLEDINVLGLEKMCEYAQGESQPAIIAEVGVGGVYGEGWTYDPNHPVFIDPLDVARSNTGQCADYANFLTYLYKSIGLQANSVTIYNSGNFGGVECRLFWIYSSTNQITCILSKLLTSCDGQTKIWPFTYHATSYAAGLLCDASLGIIDTRAHYDQWWRYYLHPRTEYPPYSHTEPPPFAPIYYDWPEFTPIGPMPPEVDDRLMNFIHP